MISGQFWGNFEIFWNRFVNFMEILENFVNFLIFFGTLGGNSRFFGTIMQI